MKAPGSGIRGLGRLFKRRSVVGVLPPATRPADRGATPAGTLVPVEPLERHDDLVVRLADPDAEVRLKAVQAVRERDGDTAVELLAPLVAAWTAEGEVRGREEAVAALESLRRPSVPVRVADALLARSDALGDADRALLMRLAKATDGNAGVTMTVASLVPELAGPRGGRAATLLGWLAPDSTEPLIDALADPAKAASAALALGETHDRRAVEKLCASLEDGDVELRRAAARALGEIRDPAALEALLRATADDDFGVRIQAGEAFDRFGHSGVALATAALLAPALGKQAQDVRAEVDATIAAITSGRARAGDAAPAGASDSLSSLSDEELAELYDIATRATDAAERAGDDDYADAWRQRADAARLEARERLRTGRGLDGKRRLRDRLGGGRRRSRLRDELRAVADY